jgi:flagellar hook-length control protein FliK
MTMPVLALLTPTAAPQIQIGGQSALTDYSEGQQQSYSEDLAALLAGMEAVLSALDTEVQQLPGGAESHTESEDLVQSMLPQPLLFDPLLPAMTAHTGAEILPAVTTQSGVEVPPALEMPSVLAEHLLEEQAGANSTLLLPAESTAELQLLSSVRTSASASSDVARAVAGQQNTLAGVQSFMVPAYVQQGTASDVVSAQNELQQRVAPAADHTAALFSALNQSQLSAQNTALGSSFTLNQNNILPGSLSKTAGLHQVMADILSPVAAVAPAHSAASSALPVWQADPLPAQSQHWGQRLVQMLADKVDLQLGLNVKTAMIRLDPPSLGSIELSVQLDGDRLTVQMHSSNTQLREAMGQGLEQLRASLQQKLGADVQIELRMGSDSSSQQQQQKAQQQLAQQTESNFHSEPEMMGTESSQPNRLNLVNQLV